ncbi:MAG TPA: Fic family protein [Solirubrobacteraceae bacterium]|nr:Fic family protein [Solirubrobacteraceae bacterium]
MYGLEQFLLVAEQVLGIDAERLARATQIPLAESALAAPFAGFGDHDVYDGPIERASILASRIMRNHPLPDGNKRVALVLMRIYLLEHGWRLTAAPGDIDRTFRAVAGRQQNEQDFCAWLASHVERDVG